MSNSKLDVLSTNKTLKVAQLSITDSSFKGSYNDAYLMDRKGSELLNGSITGGGSLNDFIDSKMQEQNR